MGAPKKADWREERRKRAWALKHEGWPQKDIAAALGVREGAVSQWMKRAREGGGTRGAEPKAATRRAATMRADQRAQVSGLLVRGAEAPASAGTCGPPNGWLR